MGFREQISEYVSKNLGVGNITELLEVPPSREMGDYALPCFTFAKSLNMSAFEAATKISTFKPPAFIEKVEVKGPYVNFFVSESELAREALKPIKPTLLDKETYMIEFFHANTHKAVHVGHLRTMCLGSAISNILEYLGNKVIRVNYQGDIGPHVAKCLWGYLKLNEKPPKHKRGVWLGKIYSQANALLKQNKKLEPEVIDLNKKIYARDKSIINLWESTRQWCIKDFNDFYKEFGVKFDRLYFESEVEGIGKQEVQNLLKQKIAKLSDGAVIVDLEKYNLGIYVAITSHGTATYHAKDLGLAHIKSQEFKFDKSLHIVGAEQSTYFKQVFKTLELIGSPLAGKSEHISYGLVMLPTGKMSSRDGTMVLFDDLYSELYSLAMHEIESRHQKLSDKEKSKRAKAISYGALKFAMLNRENNREIVFDMKKALDFTGESGPYVQYAHARCSSIIAKANRSVKKVDYAKFKGQKQILRLLASFQINVIASAKRPHVLAQYLLKLSQSFNAFYHSVPVITDDAALTNARLALVLKVKSTLEQGLGLLGIKAPDKM